MEDLELLREYTERGSEAAFSTLVERHLGLVYSAARRQVRDPQLAEEVAQSVFLILARKAGSLRSGTILSGWLFRTARFAAANVRRREERRRAHDHAVMANLLSCPDAGTTWDHLAPLLDDAMVRLGDRDRDALLLRFFENKSLQEVGAALGTNEDSAQKRVARALDKLRAILRRQGRTVSAAALGGALATHAVEAAPSGMASSIASVVVAKGATATGALLAVCRETTRALAWARARALLWRGAGPLAGTVALVVVLHARFATETTPTPPLAAAAATPVATPALSPLPTSTPPAGAAVAVAVPGERRFAFRVVDADTGAPLAGARLALTEIVTYPGVRTNDFVTDRNGYTLLPPASAPQVNWGYRIMIFQDGYIPKYVSWGGTQGDAFESFPSEYTTKLDRGTRIGGVVQGENGAPIPNVRLLFSVSGQSPGASRERERLTLMGEYHSETSDDHGHWSCNHVPASFGMITWRLLHPDLQDITYGCRASESDASVGLPRLPKEDFLSGNAVMTMKRGLEVAGIVLDEEDRPIRGAKITEDHNFRRPEASMLTDADGRFHFRNARPKEMTLTVQVDGFAPADRSVFVRENLEEQHFKLTRGRPLRGRVVDESGQPITNAIVSASPDSFNRQTFEWRGRTDREGRFAWLNAPANSTSYSAEATDYDSESGLRLVADGTEQLVTLRKHVRKRLTLIAHAVDAESKRPLEAFRVFVAETQSPGFAPSGFGLEPRGQGSDGRVTFAVSSYTTRFLVEIRADGYIPARAQGTNSGQGELSLDFEVTKGQPITGVVQSPDGKPIAGVLAVLCTGSGGAIMMAPRRLQIGRSPDMSFVETDAEGRFSFAPRLEVRGVVFGHESGFAEATPEQIASDPVVTLQAWGRIEGVLKLGPRPAPQETVSLRNLHVLAGSEPTVGLQIQTKTDEQGRFVLEGIPPGEHKVEHRLSFHNGKIGEIPDSHGVPIVVQAGQTTQVQLGGTGRRVTGRVVAPGVSGPIDWLRDVHRLSSKLDLPPDLIGPKRSDFASTAQFEAALQGLWDRARVFWASEQGKTLRRQERSYVLRFEADGSFQIDDVPPGRYNLRIFVTEPAPKSAAGSFPNRTVASASREVVVPEADSDADPASALELGEIVATPEAP